MALVRRSPGTGSPALSAVLGFDRSCKFTASGDRPSPRGSCRESLSGVFDKGCGSFETTLGIENPRVEAGLSDTLWSLRIVPITPPRSKMYRSTSSRGLPRLGCAHRKISNKGCGEKIGSLTFGVGRKPPRSGCVLDRLDGRNTMRARGDRSTRWIKPNILLLLSSPRCVASRPKRPDPLMQIPFLRLSSLSRMVFFSIVPTLSVREPENSVANKRQ